MGRLPLVVLLVLAGALVVVSTGGVTSFAADRAVVVDVADDERGYVGLETTDPVLGPGTHHDVTLLTIENQASERFATIDTEVAVDGPTPPGLRRFEAPRTLSPGEHGVVAGTVTCGGNRTDSVESWTVSVRTAGPGIETEFDRTVEVTCEASRSGSSRGGSGVGEGGENGARER